MGPYRTSRPTFEFWLCFSPNDVTLRPYLTPESVYYLKHMYDPFFDLFQNVCCKDWMKSKFLCQCLTKNTSDSVNTHVLHFCPPGLQSYLPQSLSSLCFKVGESAQLSTLKGKFIFLKSINPSSRPISITRLPDGLLRVHWVNTCCACWGLACQPCLLRASTYFLILQTHECLVSPKTLISLVQFNLHTFSLKITLLQSM